MSEIVKIQMLLFSSDPKVGPLVYGHHKRHLRFQTLNEKTLKAMGSDVKAFFKADWNERQDKWIIGQRVSDRNW